MVEPDEPSARVELDRDGVEAQLGAPRRLGSPFGEPFAGEQAEPALLARADRGERAELGVLTAADGPRRDPGLHLAEDEAAGVRGDEVQLAVAGAEVGVEDGQAARLQVGPRESLAGGSEGSSRVRSGHDGDATEGRATRVRPV
jgi:hypothetical protein